MLDSMAKELLANFHHIEAGEQFESKEDEVGKSRRKRSRMKQSKREKQREHELISRGMEGDATST